MCGREMSKKERSRHIDIISEQASRSRKPCAVSRSRLNRCMAITTLPMILKRPCDSDSVDAVRSIVVFAAAW